MTINVGDKIPAAKLRHMTQGGPKEVTTDELFKGKKVVLFAVPGAFTPTCSMKQLPGFVGNADAIKTKGVSEIVCLSVNDPWVMDAWGKEQKVGDKVHMVADGNGDLTKALGLDTDISAAGLGVRSKRYSMVVDNGTVTHLNVEKPGAFEVSNAETILKQV